MTKSADLRRVARDASHILAFQAGGAEALPGGVLREIRSKIESGLKDLPPLREMPHARRVIEEVLREQKEILDEEERSRAEMRRKGPSGYA